jgi:hypothetical protein
LQSFFKEKEKVFTTIGAIFNQALGSLSECFATLLNAKTRMNLNRHQQSFVP